MTILLYFVSAGFILLCYFGFYMEHHDTFPLATAILKQGAIFWATAIATVGAFMGFHRFVVWQDEQKSLQPYFFMDTPVSKVKDNKKNKLKLSVKYKLVNFKDAPLVFRHPYLKAECPFKWKVTEIIHTDASGHQTVVLLQQANNEPAVNLLPTRILKGDNLQISFTTADLDATPEDDEGKNIPIQGFLDCYWGHNDIIQPLVFPPRLKAIDVVESETPPLRVSITVQSGLVSKLLSKLKSHQFRNKG